MNAIGTDIVKSWPQESQEPARLVIDVYEEGKPR
jgi:hypothetical protein